MWFTLHRGQRGSDQATRTGCFSASAFRCLSFIPCAPSSRAGRHSFEANAPGALRPSVPPPSARDRCRRSDQRPPIGGQHIRQEHSVEAEDAALDRRHWAFDPVAQDRVDGHMALTKRGLSTPRVGSAVMTTGSLSGTSPSSPAEARSCAWRPRCANASSTSCFSKSSMKPTDSQPKRTRIFLISSRAFMSLLAFE